MFDNEFCWFLVCLVCVSNGFVNTHGLDRVRAHTFLFPFPLRWALLGPSANCLDNYFIRSPLNILVMASATRNSPGVCFTSMSMALMISLAHAAFTA